MAFRTKKWSLRIHSMIADATNQCERILAVDLRPHWVGFAVFDAPTRLLDFGLVKLPSRGSKEIRFIRLVERFRPRVVVIRGDRHRRRAEAFRRALEPVSARYSISVERLGEHAVRHHFEGLGVHNKEQRSALLAQQFSELAWKVPPARKRWQHEHQNMPIFDAVATGVVYVQSTAKALR